VRTKSQLPQSPILVSDCQATSGHNSRSAQGSDRFPYGGKDFQSRKVLRQEMSTEYDDEEELGDYEGRTDKEHRVGGSLQVRGGMPEGVVCDPESALWSLS